MLLAPESNPADILLCAQVDGFVVVVELPSAPVFYEPRGPVRSRGPAHVAQSGCLRFPVNPGLPTRPPTANDSPEKARLGTDAILLDGMSYGNFT